MQEGSTSLFGQHLKLPTLPSSSLTLSFSDGKKNKSFQGLKVSRVFQVEYHRVCTLDHLGATRPPPRPPLNRFPALQRVLLNPAYLASSKMFRVFKSVDLRDVKLWLKLSISWLLRRHMPTFRWRKLNDGVSRYRGLFEWTVKYLSRHETFSVSVFFCSACLKDPFKQQKKS